MVRIIITDHRAINWVKSGGNYFRGWFFDENGFHEKDDALCFFNSINDNNFVSKIKSTNGNYSCVYHNENKTYVAVDRIRSFPLFYTKFKDDVYISDSVEKLKELTDNKKFDREHVQELMATGYVTGRKTFYKDIFQVQAGEYLSIDNKTSNIQIHDYYTHKHKNNCNKSSEELCKELDTVLINVFKRLIESVKGKPIALFLSGGYDSRLVAVMLKRLNYENVYCISFGNKSNKEVIAAKNVADTLDLKWELITLSRNYLRDMLTGEDFKKFIVNAANGVCTPYYQGLVAREFIKRGLIPKESVIITGNSGDVVEGDHFDPRFVKDRLYTKDIIVDSIIENHYTLFGKQFSKKSIFREYISSLIEDKDSYTFEECHDICEFFNWRERQSKYVVNDVRCYDEFLENEWRLPLWDSEFVEFWLNVPTELRRNRKLYYQYVREEKFLTANNLTFYRKFVNYIKKHSLFIIEILYPIEKLRDYFFSENPFYLGKLKDYLRILYVTKGYRTNTITSHIYTELKQIYRDCYNSFNGLLK